MANNKSICVGCKYAEWQRKSNGAINTKRTGNCLKKVEIPVVPASLANHYWYNTKLESMKTAFGLPRPIWYDNNWTECAAFEQEEKA